tara:strand:+ start:94 stop:588 length:495 start_codon:yes stop_codon:yes gene_type:complete
MIVVCPNCNKKFNIDEKLIPQKGRLLQCSSCDHKWHYTIPKLENENAKSIDLTKKNKIITNYNDKKISINPSLTKKNNNNKKIIKNININKNLEFKTKKISKKISLAKVFNNLLIVFITFISLILILDTFKSNISNYIPILIPMLDNLYLSFFDLYSFIKDLFN